MGDLDQQLADLGVGKAEPQAASTRGLARSDGKRVEIAHGQPRQAYALQWIVLHDQQLQPQPGGVLTQARRLSKLALLTKTRDNGQLPGAIDGVGQL